jgi:zinc transport system substrate-binding protein
MDLYFKILLLFLLSIQLSSANITDARDPIKIFVSIPPQKFLVEQIGSNKVLVRTMVKPGSNPETYELTPKQMVALSESQLYFKIGVLFESVWIDRIEKLSRNLKIIYCCDNIISHKTSRHDLDAHIWTSPKNAKYLAALIKQTLVEFDPKNKRIYEKNHAVLIDKLDALDRDIRNQLAQLNNRYLIVSHPSWGYFADTYNLKQLSIEQEGSEISAKELSRLIELAKAENIHTVYTQKQVNNASANILAREISAKIVELDPLAENYIENLRKIAARIAQRAE